jgi:hypothetical protein
MAKSKGNSTPTPQAPGMQNEYYYDNGNLQSSRVYDKGKNGYVNTTFADPNEQAIQTQATGFIKDLVSKAPQAFNMSPEGLQKGVDAYTQPQIAALNNSYNQAAGAAQNTGVASGTNNSVGFNRYFADQIEKNRAQGMADIQAGGGQLRYQLPSMALQPYSDAFNLYNAALNGQQAQTGQNLNAALQGNQLSNNSAYNNFQSQLASLQNQGQGKQSHNFFGWLIGKNGLY